MATFVINRARTHDVETVISLIDEAARWLRTKDTDQWERPWPDQAGRDKRISDDIKSNKTWIVWAGTIAAATITIDTIENDRVAREVRIRRAVRRWLGLPRGEHGQNRNLPRLWSSRDVGPAFSVHRLVVNRKYAGIGLGAALLNWAGDQAAAKYEWIRIDVWTTNMALHQYYESQGFKFVRWHDDPHYPSGALFQRAIADQRAVPGITLVRRRGPRGYGRRKTARRAQLGGGDWYVPLAPLGAAAQAIWTLGRSLRSSRG